VVVVILILLFKVGMVMRVLIANPDRCSTLSESLCLTDVCLRGLFFCRYVSDDAGMTAGCLFLLSLV
jgi:hypothetical protein